VSSESLGMIKRLINFVGGAMAMLMEIGIECEAGDAIHPWRCQACPGCRRQALIDEARELLS
jgi:hypothetical protein